MQELRSAQSPDRGHKQPVEFRAPAVEQVLVRHAEEGPTRSRIRAGVVVDQRADWPAAPPQRVRAFQQRDPAGAVMREHGAVAADQRHGGEAFHCRRYIPVGRQQVLPRRGTHRGDTLEQVRRVEHAQLLGMELHRVARLTEAGVEPNSRRRLRVHVLGLHRRIALRPALAGVRQQVVKGIATGREERAALLEVLPQRLLSLGGIAGRLRENQRVEVGLGEHAGVAHVAGP